MATGSNQTAQLVLAYFTGDWISLHRSGYELCSVVLKVSCFFGQSSHIIDKIYDQIFTSLLTSQIEMNYNYAPFVIYSTYLYNSHHAGIAIISKTLLL